MKDKITKSEVLNKGGATIKEFKQFISKGNVIDMAVGVIIGNAFGKIVTSMVNDILMPIIGVIIGGHNFTGLKFTIGTSQILYGAFIQNVIDFLIVAACIFVMIKIIGSLSRKEVKEEIKEAPKKDKNTALLEEIRDLLKEKNK